MDASIFRSYDIRGVYDQSLSDESVWLIGKAIGSLLKEGHEEEVLLARDGRLSSPQLAESLAAGLQSTGCHVVDIGMVPTPLLYYATRCLPISSGLMVTGSHNPGNYNGIKMVIQGKSLTEQEIQGLYHRIREKRLHDGSGNFSTKNIVPRYIADVEQDIYLARPLAVVIDAGNGVTGKVAPALFKLLGCEVYPLNCEVDGSFPNHHPDPSQKENLQDLIRVVQEREADIGLAFDGDGDRLGVVMPQGQIIEADRLLMLFAQSVLAVHPNTKIVFDVKCTNHLPKLIQSLGGEAIMCKTGHSFIKQKMQETEAMLGGEMSGHLFFRDRWHGFDDALYAGARLLELLAAQQEADHLFATIPRSLITPELKVSVTEQEKFPLMQRLLQAANFREALDMNTTDGLRVSFQDGWGLVRPSNTTPCLIMRFEAESETQLKTIQNHFRDWLLSVKPELELPF